MAYRTPHERRIDELARMHTDKVVEGEQLAQQKLDVIEGLARLRILRASGELEVNYLELVVVHESSPFRRGKTYGDLKKRGFTLEREYGVKLSGPNSESRDGRDFIEVAGVKEGFTSYYQTEERYFGIEEGWKTGTSTHAVFVTLDDELYLKPQKVSDNTYAYVSHPQDSSANHVGASELPGGQLLTRILEIEKTKQVS